MKKSIFLIVLCCTTILFAQNPETNSRNWTVTKLANTNQLVSYPNEISYGPDAWLWITERATNDNNDDGTLYGERVVRVNPTTGVKTIMLDLHNEVYSDAGQDGLMGMAIHPDLFSDVSTTINNYVYLAYTYYDNTDTTGQPRRLRITRFEYDNATSTLIPASRFVLIEGINASNDHNSGRMKIGPDLKIYYTVGDQGHNQFANKCKLVQAQALPTQSQVSNQDWSSYQGKLLRINLDGSIPSDNPKFYPFEVPDGSVANPFSNSPFPDNVDTNRPDSDKVRSHIYTYGHRNAQGIIFDSNGTLFQSEHGDRVDDEVNIIAPGKNYGWPLIVGEQDDQGYEQCIKASAPGCNTNDNECPAGSVTHKETDFTLPVDFQGPIATYGSTVSSVPQGGFLSWPTVAPSSIDIYEDNGNFPFSKNIFVPTLKKGAIYRYGVDATNTVNTDLIEFHSSIDRYRDIAISPDGNTIYAVTDSGGSTSGPSGSSFLTIQNPGAVFKFEYQVFPEPSNQVTGFTATDAGLDIVLNWTDVTGTNLADGYAIAISTTSGNFPVFIDGTQPSQDLDIADGSGLVLVNNGLETYTFDDLDENTTYYFQITAYANIGSDIDFLTTQVAPEANATTTISLEPTVIISEVVSTDVNDAYVEIFNYGSNPVDLQSEDFKLAITYDGGSNFNSVSLTGILQPGQYYTIGRAEGSSSPDLVAYGYINGNGNDAYILHTGTSQIVDIYGVVGQNGDGQAWDYNDSRAIRKITVSQASDTWIASEWIIEGITSYNETTDGTGENISFIYDNGWTPYDPSGSSYQATDATIQNGSGLISDMTLFKNVTIDSGADLALSNGGITITENLYNNGSLTDLGTSIIMSGTVPQQVNGNDFSIDVFIIENETTVNLNLDITELLSIEDDLTVNSNNIITLKSDINGTAFVDEVTGIVNGIFTTERFIPAKRAFRFISSSVNSTESIYENWQENGSALGSFGTHITGSITGANGFDITATGSPSLFGYDNINQSWTTPQNTDVTTLTAGSPYRLFVRGDRTTDLSINTAVATNTVLRATGSLKTGTETVTNLSSIAGEFNFVGNPYQAPVDLSQVLGASTNLNSNFVYFWDPTINTRGSYVTVDISNNTSNVSSGFNNYLQPNSAFFVTTLNNGSTSLTFEENNKEVNQQVLNIFSVPINNSRLKIQLFESTEFAQGSRERDAVVLNVNATSSNLVNSRDALKFTNIDENISIKNGGQLLSIENRQSIQDGDNINLIATHYRSSQYDLNILIEGIITPAYLYDSFLNSYTALSSNGSTTYSFTIDSSIPESVNENRFQIKFSNVTLSNDNFNLVNEISVYPNPTNDHTIHISGLKSDANFKLSNMLGQEIKIDPQSINTIGNTLKINLPITLKKGTYIMNIMDANRLSSHKIILD
nr:PQQ-dependent sugar dehydrogenase [Nonlabens ulvanivorans]